MKNFKAIFIIEHNFYNAKYPRNYIFYVYFPDSESIHYFNTRSHILYNCLKSTVYIVYVSLKIWRMNSFMKKKHQFFYNCLANVMLLTSLFYLLVLLYFLLAISAVDIIFFAYLLTFFYCIYPQLGCMIHAGRFCWSKAVLFSKSIVWATCDFSFVNKIKGNVYNRIYLNFISLIYIILLYVNII